MVDKQFRTEQRTVHNSISRKVSKRMRTGGLWSKKEQECHINNLEHLAIKLALQQNDEVQVSTYSSRQFDGPESTFENGSNKECFFLLMGQRSEDLPRQLNETRSYKMKS